MTTDGWYPPDVVRSIDALVDRRGHGMRSRDCILHPPVAGAPATGGV